MDRRFQALNAWTMVTRHSSIGANSSRSVRGDHERSFGRADTAESTRDYADLILWHRYNGAECDWLDAGCRSLLPRSRWTSDRIFHYAIKEAKTRAWNHCLVRVDCPQQLIEIS